MGRRPNYDNRGFQQNISRNTDRGVFGRLQQQQQPANQGGGWGSGQRNSNAPPQRQGQQRDNNRFGAFNHPAEDQEPQNNRGSQRGGRQQPQQQQNVDWRSVVRDDLKNERPPWPFSCYAHERSKQNDLTGDYSYEEVRWAEMQAVRAGRSAASVVADFNVARKALDQQWQAVSRASRPPSMGGPAIDPPANSFSAPQPFQPATPFGQVVRAFGSHPAAAPTTPSPAFGTPFQLSPAESMPSAGPFAGTPAGISNAFGSVGAFGTPAQASPFHSQAQPQAMSAAGFGQQQTQQPVTFQQAIGSSPLSNAGQGSAAAHMPPVSHPALSNIPEDSPLRPWLATAFERGHIPETPPPREVC